MVAIARRHGLMGLRVVESESSLRMHADFQQLTSTERGRPCGMMSLELEARIAKFFG